MNNFHAPKILQGRMKLQQFEVEDTFEKRRFLIKQQHDLIKKYLKEENATAIEYARLEAAYKAQLMKIDKAEKEKYLNEDLKISQSNAQKELEDLKAKTAGENSLAMLNARNIYDYRRARADQEYDRLFASLMKQNADEKQFIEAKAALERSLNAITAEEKAAKEKKTLNQEIERQKTLNGIELMGAENVFDYRRRMAQVQFENTKLTLKKEGIDTAENISNARKAFEAKNTRISAEEQQTRLNAELSGVKKISSAMEELFSASGNKGMANFFRQVDAIIKMMQALSSLSIVGGKSSGNSPGFLGMLGQFFPIIGSLFPMFDRGGFTGEGDPRKVRGFVHSGEIVFENSITNKNREALLDLRQSLQRGESVTDFLRTSPRAVVQLAGGSVASADIVLEIRQLRADLKNIKVETPVHIHGALSGQTFLRKEFDTYAKWQRKKNVDGKL